MAFGGVGKTALVKKWLIQMGADNYRGAERVYGWSFFSQGAAEGKQASADEFVSAALKWFGDLNPTEGSPWDKGERLAMLVNKHRTLLILDGLEPLQYPAEQGGLGLLPVALDRLSLGRAHLAETQQKGTGDYSKAAEHLDLAVDGLRQAGTQHHIPRGLLARATLRRIRSDFKPALRDLNEAMSIAERGQMGLHQADAHLEYARLYLAMGEEAEAREHLATAKEMVGRMGYRRRDGEVAELEERLDAG